MIKKFRTAPGLAGIWEEEMVKETKCFVWLTECDKRPKRGFYNFFDTWQEAKDSLFEWEVEQMSKIRKMLDESTDRLNDIKEMKPPN